MRRLELQLLGLARQGDAAACVEVGRRFLGGHLGFPRDVRTGLEYLSSANLRDSPQACDAIADGLAVQEHIQEGLGAVLRRSATGGHSQAQFKLGIWLLTRPGQTSEAIGWLTRSAAQGHPSAAFALAIMENGVSNPQAVLRSLTASGAIHGAAVAEAAARESLQEMDLDRLCLCIDCALQLSNATTEILQELTVAAIELAARLRRPLQRLRTETMHSSLEARSASGDARASFLLGCALGGISCGVDNVPLVRGANVRAAAALLLRAADAGEHRAWFELYRLASDNSSPVANAMMSHYFLEKAALAGHTVAQRVLGAILLSRMASLKHSEEAIHWLYQSSEGGDALASQLLRTLVIPMPRLLSEAEAAASQVGVFDPPLGSRLMLARHFGLTKLEAMVVVPASGLRHWGLVVERNPFIIQGRVSAPRAIPAVTLEAKAAAIKAAELSSRGRSAGADKESNLRQRGARLRSALTRVGADESLFFASATSSTLERYRTGPKWAYHARGMLHCALDSI